MKASGAKYYGDNRDEMQKRICKLRRDIYSKALRDSKFPPSSRTSPRPVAKRRCKTASPQRTPKVIRRFSNENLLYIRDSDNPVESNADPSINKKLSIISKLGIISAKKGMEFASAYDSIQWMREKRRKLSLSPPTSPPGCNKFNLLPQPSKHTRNMKIMAVLNKFHQDILNGKRKNVSSECNFGSRFDKVSTTAFISQEDLSPMSIRKQPTRRRLFKLKMGSRHPLYTHQRINCELLSKGMRLDQVCSKIDHDDVTRNNDTIFHIVDTPHYDKYVKNKELSQSLETHKVEKPPKKTWLEKLIDARKNKEVGTNTELQWSPSSFASSREETSNMPIFFKFQPSKKLFRKPLRYPSESRCSFS